MRELRLLLVLLLIAAPGPVLAQETRAASSDPFSGLDFRHIGPVGNRVSAVIGEPGNPNVYYLGAASGGIFKSVDAGHSWEPIFDDMEVSSIGALALAPSDPNVLWAGTGEAFIRSNISVGNGAYRSTDGGMTWRHMGLEATGRVGRVVIDPRDPDVVFMAATGHLYGPQPERGVYRTRDGGESWEQVLFVDENTGAVDLVMDPNNPRILFAAMWQMQIWTWGRESGGPGSGIWRSDDSGDSWTRLEGHGLPEGMMGKIGLAMSPDDSQRIYALIETSSNDDFHAVEDHEGVLWRSDDGGRSWDMVNPEHALAQRPLYYSRAAVAPDDRDEIHFMSTAHSISLDGGVTFERGNAGGDNHDMWIDPLLPDRMIVGHDQGVSISTNRGRNWYRPQLPIAQMYHVYTDNKVPYRVYGNRQDGSSYMGPSNTLAGGSIPIGAWRAIGGCESGWAVPDTVSNDVVWSGCYEGILDRHQISTGITRTVSVWPDNPEGWSAADLRYRFQWTFPVHVSPHDGETVYAGSQVVHRTQNGGQSWEVISPDLTLNDVSRQQASGGLTTEDASPTYFSVLFAITESPLEAGLIWAGSNDGLVHITRDNGANWENVTDNIPGMPQWGTVSNIEPSRFEAGTAYITVDVHQLGDSHPYIYRTRDYGRSWTAISEGIPYSILSYAHVVREDPTRPGLLYAGTENGLYVSFDDGDGWQPLQGDLPHAPVHWLTIQPHFNDLVVGTYGRGFWILDDVTAVQQFTPEVEAAGMHLFAPRDAYRFLPREGVSSQPGDPAAGENPDYGASLNVYLDEVPDDDVELLIRTEAGDTVRTLELDRPTEGINRVMWDLRYESSRTPRLRTPALEHSHRDLGDREFRPAPDGGRVRPQAVPGRYQVTMTVGDAEQSTWLEVLQDPDSDASPADMRAQLEAQLTLREASDSTVALIDRLEWARRGIADLEVRFEGDDAMEDVLVAGRALSEQLSALEMNLFDLRLTGEASRQDTIRWPRGLYARIASLANYISGSDHGPTAQATEVGEGYGVLLDQYLRGWSDLEGDELAAFSRMLTSRGLPPIT